MNADRKRFYCVTYPGIVLIFYKTLRKYVFFLSMILIIMLLMIKSVNLLVRS